MIFFFSYHFKFDKCAIYIIMILPTLTLKKRKTVIKSTNLINTAVWYLHIMYSPVGVSTCSFFLTAYYFKIN